MSAAVALLSAALAATAAAAPGPRVFFTDVEAGPVTGGPNGLGVPLSIFGKGFGATRGTSRVTIGGVEVASYLVWGANNAHNKTIDMIVVQPGPNSRGGSVVVTVGGQASNSNHTFAVNSGKVHYISTGGSDTNACSATAPCRTIQNTVQAVMSPGDTVLVRGGNYSEGEIWIKEEAAGVLGQPKVIKNYPGEEVYLTNGDRSLLIDADHISVSGLNFQSGKAVYATGWASRDQRGVKVFNSTFIGTIGWAAIETTGHDHVLAGNVCDVSGSSAGTMGHCYYLTQGSNLKILYNVGGGAPGYGIHLYDERRATSDYRRIIRNVLVEGNILKSSTQRSGMLLAMEDAGGYGNYIEDVTIRNNVFVANNHIGLTVTGSAPARDLKIHNNTFYQNGRQGIFIDSSARIQNVGIGNNLIYQSPNSNCRTDCSWYPEAHIEVGSAAQNVTVENNSYHPNSPVVLGRTDSRPVVGPVQFTNASALDFHILAGSSVIDRGLTLAGVPADYDGVPRPQGSAFDVGAFEHFVGGVSTSISPAVVTLASGQSQQFTATVNGTANTAVTWSMNPSIGTLSGSGLYTAPTSIVRREEVVVTATSTADPTKSASATVVLEAPISLSVTPAGASLGPGQSQDFNATVSGTSNTAVTWSLSPAVGTISASGLYTAPGSIAQQQTVMVTATSAADPSKSASATVTLNPPTASVSVTVSPAAVTLLAGQSRQFTATVSGASNTAVTWSLSPAVGSISASGLYTAPSSISQQQTVTVTATSAADSSKSARAAVTLNPPTAPVSVAVSPTSASLAPGQTKQFTATVSGGSNTAVTWSRSPAVGTISASGLYTAPSSSTAQTVVVKATSVADPTKSANATVTVVPIVQPVISVSASPATVTLAAGLSQQFTATVSGTSNTAVTWSMSPSLGTLSSTGLYKAPSSITVQQTVVVKATSVVDATKSATATVTLTPTTANTNFKVWWTEISPTQVRVYWTAPAGQSDRDWLALSAVGAVDWWWNGWAEYKGSGTSGSFVVDKPKAPAYYEFRYYLQDGYSIKARSSALPIAVSGFSVTGTPTVVAPYAKLTASWTAPTGRPTSDIIGLYKAGALNEQHVEYQYTNGATRGVFTFTAPATPGTYEFRYRMGHKMGTFSVPIVVK